MIDNLGQADHEFSQAGKFIVFGDSHTDSFAHYAIVYLMPLLSKNNVKILGIEHSPLMNERILPFMQRRIQNGAPSEEIFNDLKLISSGVTGGDRTLRDMADIIVAATNNGIKVVGIDARLEIRNLERAADMRRRSDRRDHLPNRREIPEPLTELDRETAANADRQMVGQKPGARMAIMYGQAHSCLGEGPRLGDELRAFGTVTKISLVSPSGLSLVFSECVAPDIHIAVNTPGVMLDVFSPLKFGRPADIKR